MDIADECNTYDLIAVVAVRNALAVVILKSERHRHIDIPAGIRKAEVAVHREIRESPIGPEAFDGSVEKMSVLSGVSTEGDALGVRAVIRVVIPGQASGADISRTDATTARRMPPGGLDVGIRAASPVDKHSRSVSRCYAYEKMEPRSM